MEHDFWLERWQQDQLGWHLPATNPLLEKHWGTLGITRGAAVFVPLCGKSLDMRYLESLGHSVTGVELSEKAIEAYFDEGNEAPERTDLFYLIRYQGGRSTLYCGDFFDLAAPDILGVRAVYDRVCAGSASARAARAVCRSHAADNPRACPHSSDQPGVRPECSFRPATLGWRSRGGATLW